jgi:hypothetical protein
VKRIPDERGNAQHVEETGRYARGADAFGISGIGEIHREMTETGDCRYRRHLLGEVSQARRRQGVALRRRTGRPQKDEPIRVVKRQRPQQHGVDDAEDGGVGADPEPERQERDNGEPRAPAKRAQRIDQIATKISPWHGE